VRVEGRQFQQQVQRGDYARRSVETGRDSRHIASGDSFERQNLSFDLRKKLKIRRTLAHDHSFFDNYVNNGESNRLYNNDFSTYEKMPELDKMAYGALHDRKQKGKVLLSTHIEKQSGNNCGPNAISAAFSAYGDHVGPGVIARETTGMFTSPKAIVDFAKKRGYKPRIISFSDSKDPKGDMMNTIDKALDNKSPVLILGDPQLGKEGKSSLYMHWMNVSGKYKDARGATKYIVDDPGEGKKYVYTAEQLEKFSSNVRFGQDHQVIVMAKNSSQLNGLPPENKPSYYRMASLLSFN